ncbi:hypothetical protein ACFO1S_20915 [Cohnella boryungensis]|uniref:Integrase SAM-like N-terminal domain-containing protein n=1 Tax=Cohnella boryungensis TaxID=768479 RepID=A0ABV8SG14_9BACL
MPYFRREWVDELTPKMINDYLHKLQASDARSEGGLIRCLAV